MCSFHMLYLPINFVNVAFFTGADDPQRQYYYFHCIIGRDSDDQKRSVMYLMDGRVKTV